MRSCLITKGGESTTGEYISWLEHYHSIVKGMKGLEKEVHAYKTGVDNPKHKKAIDKLHKQMVKHRRKYASAADECLTDL